jgi:hypothetical protein
VVPILPDAPGVAGFDPPTGEGPMTWFLHSSTGALFLVCYWVYAATKNGADLDEDQLARRIHNAG